MRAKYKVRHFQNSTKLDALHDPSRPFYQIRGLSTEGQDAHPVDWNNVSGLPLGTPVDRSPFATARHKQIQQYEAYRCGGFVIFFCFWWFPRSCSAVCRAFAGHHDRHEGKYMVRKYTVEIFRVAYRVHVAA